MLFLKTGKEVYRIIFQNQEPKIYSVSNTKNVADDILYQEHFADLDYLNWFSRYERFCELRYL